jgi:hypothetical protein
MTMSDYDTDVAAWAVQQADALRRRAANEIDWDNVAEEIEDVAGRHRDRIYGTLQTALVHLLKWQFQPYQRSNSWRASVVKARERIAKLRRDIPTLASYPGEQLADAYVSGRRIAEAETGLVGLPETCPWTIEQVLDHGYWPGPPWHPGDGA